MVGDYVANETEYGNVDVFSLAKVQVTIRLADVTYEFPEGIC